MLRQAFNFAFKYLGRPLCDVARKNGKYCLVGLAPIMNSDGANKSGQVPKFADYSQPQVMVSWHDFCYKMLARGEVVRLTIYPQTNIVKITLANGAIIDGKLAAQEYLLQINNPEKFETKVREFERSIGIHLENAIPITYDRDSWSNLFSFTDLIIFGVLLYYLQKKSPKGSMSSMGTNIFSGIRKAKYTIVDSAARASDPNKIKFKDVAGLHEAKVEIKEFVDYLKNTERFLALGAKLPKGALLTGPPGCGKTLIAKAVATEAGVPFLAIAGSSFVEMVGGVGSARVRDLFRTARKLAPCIIYIDEIDSIGQKRGMSDTFNSEREQTLNQLLVEMDGMNTTKGVIILASTNRSEVLDQALTRAGRFDRQIYIGLPNFSERKELFEKHSSKIKLEFRLQEDNQQFLSRRMAALTPGSSGADIANICNEAALIAAREDRDCVTMKQFDAALDRVKSGLGNESKVMEPEEKRRVAYHEAGHAVAGWFLEYTEPVLKVSIISRGQMLGHTQFLPSERPWSSKEHLLDDLCMRLGGLISEKLFFDEISNGAENDLKTITRMAYKQVAQFGMSEKVGNIIFDIPQPGQLVFVKPYSEFTATLLDNEAKKLVQNAYTRTLKLLEENKNAIDSIAKALLERETISREEIIKLIGPRPFKEDQRHNEVLGINNKLDSLIT